jgi:hypothetical protein
MFGTYGHRHVQYYGKIGERVNVVSAASSTLGEERMGREGKGGGYEILYIDRTNGGEIAVVGREVVSIVNKPQPKGDL